MWKSNLSILSSHTSHHITACLSIEGVCIINHCSITFKYLRERLVQIWIILVASCSWWLSLRSFFPAASSVQTHGLSTELPLSCWQCCKELKSTFILNSVQGFTEFTLPSCPSLSLTLSPSLCSSIISLSSVHLALSINTFKNKENPFSQLLCFISMCVCVRERDFSCCLQITHLSDTGTEHLTLALTSDRDQVMCLSLASCPWDKLHSHLVLSKSFMSHLVKDEHRECAGHGWINKTKSWTDCLLGFLVVPQCSS